MQRLPTSLSQAEDGRATLVAFHIKERHKSKWCNAVHVLLHSWIFLVLWVREERTDSKRMGRIGFLQLHCYALHDHAVTLDVGACVHALPIIMSQQTWQNRVCSLSRHEVSRRVQTTKEPGSKRIGRTGNVRKNETDYRTTTVTTNQSDCCCRHNAACHMSCWSWRWHTKGASNIMGSRFGHAIKKNSTHQSGWLFFSPFRFSFFPSDRNLLFCLSLQLASLRLSVKKVKVRSTETSTAHYCASVELCRMKVSEHLSSYPRSDPASYCSSFWPKLLISSLSSETAASRFLLISASFAIWPCNDFPAPDCISSRGSNRW